MRRFKLTGMVLLAVLAILVLNGCHRSPEQRAERFMKHLAEELNLNEAQKAEFDKIKNEFLAKRPDMVKMRTDVIKEANELMRSAALDKAKLDAMVEKNRAMAGDMMTFIGAKFAKIHEILTPEQREKLVTRIEKYHKHE